MIPVGHQAAHAGQAAENLRHADGERHGAARPARDHFADLRLQLGQVHDRETETIEHLLRRVDRVVVAWMQ